MECLAFSGVSLRYIFSTFTYNNTFDLNNNFEYYKFLNEPLKPQFFHYFFSVLLHFRSVKRNDMFCRPFDRYSGCPQKCVAIHSFYLSTKLT